jgi:hypothetical protein
MVGLIIDQFINRSADRAMINPESVSLLADDSELYARAMETSLKSRKDDENSKIQFYIFI